MATELFKRSGTDAQVLGAYLSQLKGNLTETRRPDIGGTAGELKLQPGQGAEPKTPPEYANISPSDPLYVASFAVLTVIVLVRLTGTIANITTPILCSDVLL